MALERELEQSKRELECFRNGVEEDQEQGALRGKARGGKAGSREGGPVQQDRGELESAKNNIIEKEYELEHQMRREQELESALSPRS